MGCPNGQVIIYLGWTFKGGNSAKYNATGTQVVTASGDETARIWDAQSGELIHILEGHKSYVYSAEFNAEGSQIVTASGDKTARIWDIESGELLHTLEGHYGDVYSAEFNPAGTQVVTVSRDDTARYGMPERASYYIPWRGIM